MNRSKVIEQLKKSFPEISGIRKSEELGYSSDGIFLGDVAEGGTIDEVSACNYYGFESDPKEETWILGIHVKLYNKLTELGYFAECQDPGTYLAWEI